MNPKKIIKKTVVEAAAYHVANADGFIKLDAMENPYSWPKSLKKEWIKQLQATELNRYPDPDAGTLRLKLNELMSLPNNIDMMFGNGSDELIQIILLALNNDSNVVMAPEPTFVMYRLLSNMLELEFVGIPLNDDWSLNLPAMLEAIEQQQPAVIFIAWPNNPTGNAFNATELEVIIDAAPGLVVIDEAYHVFAQKTMLHSLQENKHVLLMRTFSKLGLAGLRLGMLFGASEWISEFNKLRLPYNIGSLNQLSAEFILDNVDVLETQAKQIREDRQHVFNALDHMENIQAYPSDANFILFRVNSKNGADVYQALLDKKILIKNLHGSHPLLENCLRVTIGTEQENNSFLNAINEIMRS